MVQRNEEKEHSGHGRRLLSWVVDSENVLPGSMFHDMPQRQTLEDVVSYFTSKSQQRRVQWEG